MQELPFLHEIKNNLKIEQIPIHKIRYHEKNNELFQKRKPEYIRELSSNIQKEGLHEPISVKYDFQNDNYLCLSGEHRVEAVKRLGWTEISGYKVNPEDELSYLIRRNILKPHIGHKARLRVYKIYCPEILNLKFTNKNKIEEVSKKLSLSLQTIQSDLKKFHNQNSEVVNLEELETLWSKKRIKNLRINLSGLSNGNYLLNVSGKNLSYEWVGKLRNIIHESAKAARSVWYDKNFKEENLEAAQQIRQLRIDAGLTQFQLSQALGYSQSYLAELESGKWQCSENLFESIASYCYERIA
ncbi:helix-turn-helix domain-containing protein [Leptospira mayottensis]|uniref:ParB-like protein n=2 Tax=Leptospira mayottensis TaxID=1137606 RepID=A0AA87MLE5_9LEPT|nr:helix-turn-helix domain-containing protein [Leptospira mayottensis]AXR66584.1 helix-turn-helix domain-containing protein [Leptospira mayottensis]AZQ04221.1 chromosome partitioning protein [Leptospira mayottensis 200901116]EKR98107.1 ParB-like protein [Leptospira mayottensis 200901122]TGN04299.1 helix-turn-helix domain-containing protein [Leptospira mayottensis]